MSSREKTIGIVLVALIAIGAVMNFSKSKPSTPAPVNTVEKGPKASAQEEAPLEDDQLDIDGIVVYVHLRATNKTSALTNDPFRRIDPTLKLKSTSLDFSELVLDGIVWEEDEPVALINNEILKVGDTLYGFKVHWIEKDEVILLKGNEEFSLKLFMDEQ